ncbi:MAG TPA: pirin family protein [Burkholderiaceae bacterium]|nr:pirin family protein [Burkholderiaceae bacterium]
MAVTLIEPAHRELAAGFAVRRALPAAARRAVGPFVFFDHFGPVALERAESSDVRPHPHIGLATVTWLFEGEIMHRDSLGTVQPIRPGEVNWMSSGVGIVHSERAPESRRGRPSRSHGLQAWLALPRGREDDAPSFLHVPADRVPVLDEAGARFAIVAGDAWGRVSPVPVPSRTLYAVGTLAAGAELALPGGHAERAVYVVEGAATLDGVPVPAGTLAAVDAADPARLRADADARIAVIGGEPLDGPRFVWWNFVASSRERIEDAKARWRDDRFPAIEGETERIPLPER